MPPKAVRKRRTPVRLVWECDPVGRLAAAVLALVVLLVCWWREVSALATAVRVLAAAVVAYPAAFVFVLAVQSIVSHETRRARELAKAAQEQDEASPLEPDAAARSQE